MNADPVGAWEGETMNGISSMLSHQGFRKALLLPPILLGAATLATLLRVSREPKRAADRQKHLTTFRVVFDQGLHNWQVQIL